MNPTSAETARTRAEFFGLRHLPFDAAGPGSAFHSTGSRRQALEFLKAQQKKAGVSLITGDTGTGKTSAVRAFLRDQGAESPVVLISMPDHGAIDLVRETCKRFCTGVAEAIDATELLRELSEELRRTTKAKLVPLVIVDQVERLTEESLSPLVALAAQIEAGCLPLSLVLVASPIGSAGAVDIEGAITHTAAARHAIAPFDRTETAKYLEAAFKAAGGDFGKVIEAAAIDDLRQLSRGVAAEINAICDAAMRLAHRTGDRLVRRSHVAAAVRRSTMIEKTAEKANVLPSSSRTTPAESRSFWPSVSLADVESAGESSVGLDNPSMTESASIAHEPALNVSSNPRNAAMDDTPINQRPAFDYYAGPERLVSEVATAVDDLHQRAVSLDARTQHIAVLLDTLDDRIQRAEAATSRSCEAELRLRTIAEGVAAHAEALQDRTTALLGITDSAQDVQESLRQLGASAQAIASAASQRLSEAATNWQRTIEHAGHQATSAIAERAESLEAQVAQAALLINERGPKFLRLAEHQLQDAIRDAVSKLTPVKAEVQGLLSEATVVLSNAKGQMDGEHERAQRRVEQMQSQAADALIAVSAACEKADARSAALEKAAKGVEVSTTSAADAAAELDREKKSAKTAAADLARATSSARHVQDAMTALSAGVEAKSQQLASHESAARMLLNQVTDATLAAADAAKLLEGIDLQRTNLQAAAHLAQKTHAELDEGLEETLSVAAAERQKLEALISTAQQLAAREPAAAQLLTEVRSTTETAINASRKLDEKRVELEGRLDDKQAQLSAVAGRAKALLADLTSSVERAEVSSQALHHELANGASTTTKLQDLVKLAMSARSQIQGGIAEAIQQATSLREQTDRAHATSSRGLEVHASLTEINAAAQATLASASAVSSTLSDAVSRSAQSASDAAAATDAAQAQSAQLQDILAKGAAHVEKHGHLVGDAEALLGRVAAQVDSLGEADARLQRFGAAAEAIEERLAELGQQVSAAKAAVGNPQRILSDAQAYAAQLERVCDAVRKVKTNVSQAALAADERARELTAAGQEAAQRLHSLRQELTAAAQTLAQWVQEADRAQVRLESTVQSVPSIRETHAPDSLKSLAHAADALVARTKPARKLHRLPDADQKVAAARPPSREEEIAKLLAEARKARKDVETIAPRGKQAQEPSTTPSAVRAER